MSDDDARYRALTARAPRVDGVLLLRYVVAEQHVLIAHVQFAVGNDRMRPGRRPASVRLFKAAAFDILLLVRLNQKHRAVLTTIVDAPIRESDRTFGSPALAALVPQNVTGRKVETKQIASTVAAIGTIEGTVDND